MLSHNAENVEEKYGYHFQPLFSAVLLKLAKPKEHSSYFFRQSIFPAESCIMPTLVPFASIFLIVSKSSAISYSLLYADIDGSDGAGRAGESPLLSCWEVARQRDGAILSWE